MNNLDDDIRRALGDENPHYDLDREEGIFSQMVGLFHGKMRWMAIVVVIESIALMVLIALACIAFFRTDDTQWQIFYATGVLLLAGMLLLVKLWGWMQMNRNAILREIKRLELRLLEHCEQRDK